MKKTLQFLVFSIFLIQKSNAQSPAIFQDTLAGKIFTPTQLQEDFNYLRNLLERTHPGLYRYTPKPVMQQKLDSIAGLLGKEMGYYEFYALLSALMADIRCSHTYIVPKEDINTYMTSINTIPFELLWLSGKMYVVLNGTGDQRVRPGSELTAINGRSPRGTLDHIYRYTWSDGYIRAAKQTQANGVRFALLYYLFVERPDSFHLQFLTPDGKPEELIVAAQPYEIYSQQYLKNPVNKPVMDIYGPRNKKDEKNKWRLEYPSRPNTASLVFRSFGGGNSSEAAARKMRDFMEKSLKEIRKKNITNLVIDLRSNSGGWDSQGVELMKYLIKDSLPFRYYQRSYTITDDPAYLKLSDLSASDLADVKKELIANPDGTFELDEKYNPDKQLQQPAANRFDGNVYFLINGGTVSAASEFTAVAKSHHTGVFVGTETGGAYEGGNGGSFLHFSLPNSRFYAGTPLIYSENAVDTPREKGRGTLPDHNVVTPLKDVLSGNDSQMEFVLKLITDM